jgi:hypothetical protein
MSQQGVIKKSMKTLKKFWGVALVVVLLSSLLVIATPASAADPLRWEVKLDAPSGLFFVLNPGTDVLDYDFSSTGAIGYAVTGPALMQTVTGGGMWSNITAKAAAVMPANMSYNFIAIAPDDPNVIVTANGTTCVAISINGGTTFTNMGVPQSVGATTTIAVINSVEVSPVITGGVRYVAVSGIDSAGGAAVFYYNYGGGVGTWKNARTDFSAGGVPIVGQNATLDFQFSPNFASDLMALAVTTNTTGATDIMNLEMLNFNLLGTWNSEAGYPVAVYSGAGALVAAKASLTLSPEYDGSDESLRIAFIGAAMTDGGTQVGGVFRTIDTTATRIYGATTGVPVNSVAYDGTNLAAGSYDTNNVYRCDAPLSSSPTFLGARALKRIGIDDAGNDAVQLMFRGETLYGGKRGAASAISKSTDYGNVWNDFTLLDSAITTVNDLYFSATGDPWYMAANDAVTESIFRISAFSVTRVLCVPVTAPVQDIQLDGIASDGNVLYASDMEATASAIYFTDNGGLTRWFGRTSLPSTRIADVAVESASTIYYGAFGTTTVYKSTNKAFSFPTNVDCKLSAPNTIFDMKSLSEGNLLIGGTFTGVVYSTDGGATFTSTLGPLTFTGGVFVDATGLASGDYIFAAEDNTKNVWRCAISPANFLGEFKSMNAPAQTVVGAGDVSENNTGLVLTNGVLYAMSSNGTQSYINSTLQPTNSAAVHTAAMWRTQFATAASFAVAASLKTSSGAPGSIMLYDWNSITQGVSYLDDNVALGAATLIGPADKALIQIASALTGAAQPVNFTWNRLSLSTSYELQASLDSTFNQLVNLGANSPVVSSLDPVSAIVVGGILAPIFQPGTTYYWRTRSITPFTSAWSEVRQFTVQPTAASVPSIASPSVGSVITGTPAFSWSPVSGATSYKFELDTGTAFTAPLYAVTATGAGVQLPPSVKLATGKTYFWRVKSLTPVESDWSSVANFVVAEPAVVVTPTATVAPTFTVTMPPVTTQVITVPPATTTEVNPTYIWAIIIIGAILVIAVIVLIVRTRRSV